MKLKFATLIIVIGLAMACKKDKEESKPKIDGSWVMTSLLKDGKETFNIWKEYGTTPIICNQPGKTVTCIGEKARLSSSTLTLLDDKTYIWSFNYDVVENDLSATRSACSCVFEPQYQEPHSYAGSWYTADDGKSLMQKDNSAPTVLETYVISSLTNNTLQFRSVEGQVTYEYSFRRQ